MSIKNNSNNTDLLNTTIEKVGTGHLFLDVDKDFVLKIVKFDKNKYTDYKELEAVQALTSPKMFGRLGYIQSNGMVSTG
jgi:hypothetical protein